MKALFGSIALLALAASLCAIGYAAAQTSADVLAAQMRAQGYQCDPPLNAERDVKQSKPGEAAWILTCGKSKFRIRLDPGMAAHVEAIE
jgi:hypothetical protein